MNPTYRLEVIPAPYETVNKLEELVFAAAKEPALKEDLEYELLRSKVFVIGKRYKRSRGETVGFNYTKGTSGGSLVMIYTSEEAISYLMALHGKGEKVDCVGLKAEDMLVLIEGKSGFVLNQGLPGEREYQIHEVGALLKRQMN